ncbi:hypothetical protein C5167_016644 [Papaver somniferum]|nr:hypothetical protein C5167_016644 [Papaver somniferum]
MAKNFASRDEHFKLARNSIGLLLFVLILINNGSAAVMSIQNTTRLGITDEFKVGVVLDLKLPITKVWLTSMNMALFDFYSSTKTSRKRRLVLHVADSNADILDASFAAINLIQDDEVQAIIGPLTSAQAIYMLHLGKKTQIPIISFTATSPSISPSHYPYFIRTTHQDSSQVDAIAAVVQTFKWREVVPIYEDTEYGNGFMPYLIDAFHNISTRVPYRSVLPESATDDRILQELYKLMTMQTRVFVLHMGSYLGVRIFEKAKTIGMMSKGYVWIVTDGYGQYLSSFNSSVLDTMQGVIGIRRYVPKSLKLRSFKSRWKKKFRKENPDSKKSLDIYGILAYDTIWLLANAIEKLERLDSRFLKQNDVANCSHVAKLGISQIGTKLLQEITNTKFKGLSGHFSLVDRQLHVHTFHILNVFGRGVRGIGIWTSSDGIIKDISSNGTRENRHLISNHDNLRPIIWPGNTTAIPKGWINPTGEKKLRIGVPLRSSYTEFVKVTRNPSSNDSVDVTGYCIDVFIAAIGMLPYAVPYEFIPFQNANHTAAGTYNDLIYQVYLQKFDAVVGDVTITANRSQYVDYTLPYVEAGASMIVLTRKDFNKEALIFFLPLEWRLWLTIVAFFIYIGCVIWILEHRGNREFRGGPHSLYQMGTMLSFSFSMLVFAHKEKVLSSPGRFVMILWFLAVFILTTSYTASYSAMLLANRFQPTFTDVNHLIKNGYNVGYKSGSFIEGMLKQMGFDESNLKGYRTPEECDEAFSKKRQDGGIVAAIDELPYIELLLAQYCDKYTKVGDIYPTGGFGFVFPKGSPLGLDISRTILSVREDKEKMKRIRHTWFGSKRTCSDHESSSYSLTLHSFQYLFIFVGVLSLIPLLADLLIFLYKNQIVLTSPNTSISQKFVRLVEKFNEEDEKRLRYYEYHEGIGSQGDVGIDPERGEVPT